MQNPIAKLYLPYLALYYILEYVSTLDAPVIIKYILDVKVITSKHKFHDENIKRSESDLLIILYE